MRTYKSFPVAAVGLLASQAGAQTLGFQPIASGISNPVFVTSAPGDPYAIYVVEQRVSFVGRVHRVDLRTNTRELFHTVSGVSSASEQGLLGLAFHPAHATNGRFFVNYTETSWDTRVDEFSRAADPFATESTSQKPILGFDQFERNHNGGWIAFGPEGYLWIATGDGGSGNDPEEFGQDLGALQGKMLRIDIDGDDFPGNTDLNYSIPPTNPGPAGTLPGALPEIYHYGLRNPWRNAFDLDAGLLFIADVGQGQREEVNAVLIEEGGQNFGWRCFEGTRFTGLPNCVNDTTGITMPEHEYNHQFAGFSCSVTGGEVYSGPSFPALDGLYFFADYCSQTTLTMEGAPGAFSVVNRTGALPLGASPLSFGKDAYGELYLCTDNGLVRRIADNDASYSLCTADVTTDNVNPGEPGYGVPDGGVNGADLSYYIEQWLEGSPLVGDQTTTNANPGGAGYGAPDSVVDGSDLSYYVESWLAGCA